LHEVQTIENEQFKLLLKIHISYIFNVWVNPDLFNDFCQPEGHFGLNNKKSPGTQGFLIQFFFSFI